MTNTDLPQRLKSTTPPFLFSPKLIGKTKKNFEIVIARYDEDISWSNNYKEFRTIYNKGNDMNEPHIKLKNKGHLADTILRHIISNYNNLADVTFFCHGSFNYRNDQIITDTGNCHMPFSAFIQTTPNTLIYILRRDLPHPNETFYNYPETTSQIYQQIFGKQYIPNFPWGCGKWISVSRNNIHKTPIETYQKMLDFVLKPHNGEEPSQFIYRTRGIFIERFILKCFM